MYEIDSEGDFHAQKLLNINKQQGASQIIENEDSDSESEEEDEV